MLHVITTYSDGRELTAKYTPGAAPLADQIAFERYYRKPVTVMAEYGEYNELREELEERGETPEHDQVPLAEHLYFMVYRATLREHKGEVPDEFDAWTEVVTGFEFQDDEANAAESPEAAAARVDAEGEEQQSPDPTRPAERSSKSRRSRSRPASRPQT